MALQVELVTPERVLYSGEASMVRARTLGGGDIAFQPGHAAFIGALATWTLTIYETGGEERWAAVHGGFIEVSHDHVKVLCDIAELSDQIDVERARRAAERAEVRQREVEDQDALGSLARAHARIRATGGLVDV